jgi:hypothetical protein
MPVENAIQIFPVVQVRRAGMPWSVLDPAHSGIIAFLQHWDAAIDVVQIAHETTLQKAAQFLSVLSPGPARTKVYNFLRKARKCPPDQPLFPPDDLPENFLFLFNDRNTAIEQMHQAGRAFEKQYQEVYGLEIAALQQVAADDTLQRALLLTSHDLLRTLPDWCTRIPAQFTKKDRQIARSVWQYVARAAAKTSPRSRFTTTGVWMEEGARATAQRKIVPNAALLPALYEVLLTRPAFREALWVRLNPCIVCEEPVTYRWLYCDGQQEGWQQCAAAPELSWVVACLLQHSRRMRFAELHTLLQNAADPETAESFLTELTEVGFLEWEWPENGLSPAWCSNLLQFLGWMPLDPIIVEAAMLLQWLRTTARTLPYQTIEESMANLEEGVAMYRNFIINGGVTVPDLLPEELFFEEVIHQQQTPKWKDSLEEWAAQLENFLENPCDTPTNVPPRRESFLDYTAAFLQQNMQHTDYARQHNFFKANSRVVPAGALLQVYQEGGKWKAVVNALYPGGGKLLARWLWCLPAEVTQALEQWDAQSSLTPFPWHPWSNAAFQPAPRQSTLAVPGGRFKGEAEGPPLLLGHLYVCKDAARGSWLEDAASGRTIVLADRCLDAVAVRPPMMQSLGQMGHGWGDRSEVLRRPVEASQPLETGVVFRPRHTSGLITLHRATWTVVPDVRWDFIQPGIENYTVVSFLYLYRQLQRWQLPRRFFVQPGNLSEKPQYIDQQSVLALQVLEKIVRRFQQQTPACTLVFTEMLPQPEQTTESFAEEIAIEWKGKF